jgi:deazaflavin-dependent oxidoreductase (nitroreductase family)
MLLLTTTGRKSGEPRTVPLLYLPEDEGYVVIASYGGRPHHPDWYLNLRAEPHARVQIDGRAETVTATDLAGDERERLWRRAVDAHAGYVDYQARTERVIPVVLLVPDGTA